MITSVANITSIRLPTEKAHGVHTVHMCSAFADVAGTCTLLHPKPHRSYGSDGQDMAAFYNAPDNFRDLALPFPDLLYHTTRHFRPAAPVAFRLQQYAWSCRAALFCKNAGFSLHNTHEPLQALLLGLLGLPTIIELHSVPGTIETRYLRRFIRTRGYAGITTLTHPMREVMSNLLDLGTDEIAVTPCALDTRPYAALPPRQKTRHALGLPQDRPIIGYVGRFTTMGMEKGIPQLIEAAARLRDMPCPPLLLCVGGPIEQEPKYRRIADATGLPQERLIIRDYAPHREIPSWLCACDVLPINWENTPYLAINPSSMKMFEYMATGIPIVASDLPSLRDVLRHDENALLVPAGDVDALTNTLRDVLARPEAHARLGAAARREVLASHTWRNRAQAMVGHAETTLRRKDDVDGSGKRLREIRRPAVAILGSMRYASPLDPTSAQKFSLMAGKGSLYVIGQSGRPAFRSFTEHAHFVLLPRLPLPGTGFLSIQFFSPFVLLWLIFRRRLDCIIAQSPFEGASSALAKALARLLGRRVALVVESHGDFEASLFLTRTIRSKKLHAWIIRTLARFALRRADAFRAVSRSTAQQLQRWSTTAQVTIYPAWIFLDPFYAASHGTGRGNDILFAGDIAFLKGIDVLCEAFAGIHERYPETRLRLAGPEVNQPFRIQLEQLVKRLDIAAKVDFLGKLSVADLATEMAMARAVVLPSRSEGTPRVLVESLAAGTPIVCTQIGGMPDIAADPSYSRCLPVGDSKALRQGLEAFLEPYDDVRMRDICRHRAAEIFAPKTYVDTVFNVAAEARARAGLAPREEA